MFNRFDYQETWQITYTDQQITRKAQFISQLIPKDVKTIIDIGCGNGIITNALAKVWDVTGLDNSKAALEHLKCASILASATAIPLPDNSFDLALSSEMLEHLADHDMQMAVSELKRIASKYILISVPLAENLEAGLAKCPRCSVLFNVSGHLQSFTKYRLQNMFIDEYKVHFYKAFGPLKRIWNPALLKARHSLGQWTHPGLFPLCPQCLNADFPPYPSNILTKIVNGLNNMIAPLQPYWQIMLLERK